MSSTAIENRVEYQYSATEGRLSTVRRGDIPVPQEFNYTYTPNSNLLASVSGPAHIAWGYDSLGQVVKADSSIADQDRAYQYDGIGNRISGGGFNPPSQTSYTANALNQYSAIGSINPSYDDDGNASAYPLPANVNANSTLIWDGENRLIEAQVTGGSTVTYSYDAQSRRIAESSAINNQLSTIIYIYDGWNPIGEYWRAGLQPAALTKTYTWGVDLSGSMKGAGGVGGLLAVTDSSGTHYPTYDGNGNVSEYLDTNGATVAHYEYDPFGKTTVATGSKANDFAHRFSTKPLDVNTGLYYYGYRFYDPETGRWPSKDPIGEIGHETSKAYLSLSYLEENEEDGIENDNEYAFGPNSPLNGIDVNGEVWHWVAVGVAVVVRVAITVVSVIRKVPKPKPPIRPKPPGPKPKPKPKPKGCKPCMPAVGSLMYETHTTHSHGGSCPHVHIYKVNQIPYPSCICKSGRFGHAIPGSTPPPGAIPRVPVAGGGKI